MNAPGNTRAEVIPVVASVVGLLVELAVASGPWPRSHLARVAVMAVLLVILFALLEAFRRARRRTER